MKAKHLVAGAIVVAVVLASLVGWIAFATWRNMRFLHQREHSLLYQTDHQAILDACRLMWKDGSKYGKDEGGYFYVDPDNRNLPEAVHLLDAHDITIWASGLNIELGGQGEHYGFESFFGDPATDSKRTVWKDAYPSTKLTPELYFYAESGIAAK